MTAATNDGPWADWLGKTDVIDDVIGAAPARLLLSTLDDAETTLSAGDALPPAWHWMYFLPTIMQSELKRDGLPMGSGMLPPVGLPRRMFGGCKIDFLAPLPIGATARRESAIVDIKEKRGRSGQLVILDVRHRIHANDVLCIEETTTSVFREEGSPSPVPEVLPELPPAPAGAWVRDVEVNEAMLFRYSAVTFNAHRIHYDRPYATGVEGYGGLVVHGPLLATLLLEVVRRNTGKRVTSFVFRALAPVYDIAPFRTQGVPQADGSVDLAVIGPDGSTAMSATVTLE